MHFTRQTTLLASDLETPVGLFIRLVGNGQGILLESAAAGGRWGRYSIIASDFALAASCRDGLLDITCADEGLAPLNLLRGLPFAQGLRALMRDLHIGGTAETLPPITRALYGYLGYGAASLLDPVLEEALPPGEAEACLVLPGTIIVFDHGYNRITSTRLLLNGRELAALPGAAPSGEDAPGPCAGASSGRPPLGEKTAYLNAVSRIRESIRRGEILRAVLSAPFSAPLGEPPFNLYRRLRRATPSPYMFYMRLPVPADRVLLGSSPEVLVTCEAGKLRLSPLAGTRPRSRDLAEDALFGDELLQDSGEKAEHAMLVDLGRADLGRIASPGSVKLERFMEVEHFSQAMHLTSRISADLAPGLEAVDVLSAAFPAGTVSGVPKIRAIELTAREEGRPRGPYAGAIGWLGLDKDSVNLDFGITVRSLWVRGGQVCWQAGAGIVRDSVPRQEWEECLVKAEAIRKIVLDEAPLENASENQDFCSLSPAAPGGAFQSKNALDEGERIPHIRPPGEAGRTRPEGEKTVFGGGGRAETRAGVPLRMASILDKLARSKDLETEEAAEAFARLLDGELSPSQAGALLLGLRAKGESPDEVGEAVNAVLDRAVTVPPIQGPVMDIVGTGGDGKNSFNCSTATALSLAGLGHRVLKHGNRSASSRCGSADVLEGLGVPLDTPPEAVPLALERERFVFLFASSYHPSFRHIMPVRRELGVRTLFNILGPLVNPARPTHHLFGVADAGHLSLVAAALARSASSIGAVVYGAGGYDELSPLGKAQLIFVHKGRTRPGCLDPAEYGFAPCAEPELAVSGPEEATAVLRDILLGRGSRPMRDMLALNLGLALYLLDSEKHEGESLDQDRGYNRPRMQKAMRQAMEAVSTGAGRRFCHA